jgi:hypothetical protein
VVAAGAVVGAAQAESTIALRITIDMSFHNRLCFIILHLL